MSRPETVRLPIRYGCLTLWLLVMTPILLYYLHLYWKFSGHQIISKRYSTLVIILNSSAILFIGICRPMAIYLHTLPSNETKPLILREIEECFYVISLHMAHSLANK